MLAALGAAGEAPPDLVVADHGFAGAAGEAVIESSRNQPMHSNSTC
jgi:hypothetical protein